MMILMMIMIRMVVQQGIPESTRPVVPSFQLEGQRFQFNHQRRHENDNPVNCCHDDDNLDNC